MAQVVLLAYRAVRIPSNAVSDVVYLLFCPISRRLVAGRPSQGSPQGGHPGRPPAAGDGSTADRRVFASSEFGVRGSNVLPADPLTPHQCCQGLTNRVPVEGFMRCRIRPCNSRMAGRDSYERWRESRFATYSGDSLTT